MTIKRKRKKRPKHSAPFIDSERYQHQFKLHQRRTKKLLQKERNKIMAQINNIVIHEKTAISSML